MQGTGDVGKGETAAAGEEAVEVTSVEELFFHIAMAAAERRALDLILVADLPPTAALPSRLQALPFPVLSADDVGAILRLLDSCRLGRTREVWENGGEGEFVADVPGLGRLRVNVFRQRGTYAAVIRAVRPQIPTLEDLGLPSVLEELLGRRRGLILVAGPSAAGKSSTLAAMVDYINRHRNCHIISIERPVEYSHQAQRSIISQRSVPEDVSSYDRAVRAAVREAPDVLVVGDVLDAATARAALLAAEAGHLVIAALHTRDATEGINRLLGFFPLEHRTQAQVQVANALVALLAQQLIPRRDERGRVLATEVLLATTPIKHLIRTGQTHRILTFMQSGRSLGMHTMEDSLVTFTMAGMIDFGEALTASADPGLFANLLRRRQGAEQAVGAVLGRWQSRAGTHGGYGLGVRPEGSVYRGDFGPEGAGLWSGSGLWELRDGVLAYRPDPFETVMFAQVSDYSIWLERRPVFRLRDHVRVIVRGWLEEAEEYPSDPPWCQVWVVVMSVDHAVATIPREESGGLRMDLDGYWQTLYFHVPYELDGMPVKIFALRFSNPRAFLEIRELVFT